jgi:hypothetical protein
MAEGSSSWNGTFVDLPYTSLVEASKTGRCFLFAISNTTSVVRRLVAIVRTGFSTTSRTPTAAARWKTASTRSTNSATSARFSTVSTR